MKFFRFLLSFITPQVIFRATSPLSGEITVVQHFGQRSLIVGGLVQSVSPSADGRVWGRLVEEVLRVAESRGMVIENVLILGLGGGTLVHLLQKELGPIPIDAVEIDPVVVDMAGRYFALGRVKNLRTLVGDACSVVTHPQNLARLPAVGGVSRANPDPAVAGEGSYSFPRYSVIIVDLYLGTTFPPAAQGEKFFQGLQNLMADDGLVVFNRTEKDDAFSLLLRNYFAEITVGEVLAPGGGKNYLFLGRRKR